MTAVTGSGARIGAGFGMAGDREFAIFSGESGFAFGVVLVRAVKTVIGLREPFVSVLFWSGEGGHDACAGEDDGAVLRTGLVALLGGSGCFWDACRPLAGAGVRVLDAGPGLAGARNGCAGFA